MTSLPMERRSVLVTSVVRSEDSCTRRTPYARCTAAETYWLTYTALPSGAAKKMESPSLAKDSESVPGQG